MDGRTNGYTVDCRCRWVDGFWHSIGKHYLFAVVPMLSLAVFVDWCVSPNHVSAPYRRWLLAPSPFWPNTRKDMIKETKTCALLHVSRKRLQLHFFSLSISLSSYLSIYLTMYPSIDLSIYSTIYLSLSLSMYLSISIHLSTYLPINLLYVDTQKSKSHGTAN